jgi:hypothetical protein
MEPVEPTIEIGLGPSHVLLPGSATARPGQAGGGPCCIEQHVLLTEGALLSLLWNVKSTTMSTGQIKIRKQDH